MAKRQRRTKPINATPPAEGSVIAIPLPKGGFGIAVVTRAGPPVVGLGAVFAYITAKMSPRLPTTQAFAGLQPHDVGMVGWLPLKPIIQKRWKVVGEVRTFRREQWVVPPLSLPPGRGLEREMAVEIHDDEASGAVLANLPPLDARIQNMPVACWETQASPFEKGLEKALHQRTSTIWEAAVKFVDWTSRDIDRWRTVRARLAKEVVPPVSSPIRPRDCAPGDLFVIPLANGGYGVVLLARKWMRTRSHFALFLCGWNRRFDKPPALNDVQSMVPTDVVYYGVELNGQMDVGRWQRPGRLASFSAPEWFVPPSLNRVRGFPPSLDAIHFTDDQVEDTEVVPWSPRFPRVTVDELPTVHGLGMGRFAEFRLPIELDGGSDVSGALPSPERLRLWREMNSVWQRSRKRRR